MKELLKGLCGLYDIINKTVDEGRFERNGLQSLHFLSEKQFLLPLTSNEFSLQTLSL